MYIIVGGRPFTMYTGTTTYTGLSVVGNAASKEEAKAIVLAQYEECGGLLLVIDSETGKEADLNFTYRI